MKFICIFLFLILVIFSCHGQRNKVDDSVKKIRFNQLKIRIDSPIYYSLFKESGNLLSLDGRNRPSGSIRLVDNNIQTFDLSNLTLINAPYINYTNIDTIHFFNLSIKTILTIYRSTLPKVITMETIYFPEKSIGEVDLTKFSNFDHHQCSLIVYNCDFSKIKLNYDNFSLLFSNTMTNSEKENTYKLIIDEQSRDGFKAGYKKISIEYKQFKYQSDPSIFSNILNILDRYWWNYGFDTNYLFRNSIFIYICFTLFNMLFYEQILTNGYPIKEFILANNRSKKKSRIKYFLITFFYCLIFTGNIFWGIKLDIDRLKLRNILIVSLIVFEYVCGIVLIAFMVHYAFTN